MRILLISNTGRPYLQHCRGDIADFLAEPSRVAFITAASLGDEDRYFAKIYPYLVGSSTHGTVRELVHAQWNQYSSGMLDKADAIFVGGGNTYALLMRLKQTGLLEAIRNSVNAGMPYIGSSAGANITGPNILTTNDWNVVALTSFGSLGFVPFNINPHYVECGTAEKATTETREDRISEYHLLRSNPVVGIEEDTVLRIEDGVANVSGVGRVKIFRRDEQPLWLAAGERFDLDMKMLPHKPRLQDSVVSYTHADS